VITEEREVEQEWSGNSRTLAVRAERRMPLAWEYQSFDRVPRDDVASAVARLRFPFGLKRRLWECAEVFIAASGVLAVLMIVLFMTATLRGIHSLRHR
jgi:hypothetical protein